MPILYLILFEFCETFSCVLEYIFEPFGANGLPKCHKNWMWEMRSKNIGLEEARGESGLSEPGPRMGIRGEEGQDEGKTE